MSGGGGTSLHPACRPQYRLPYPTKLNIREKKVGLDTLTVQYYDATMSIPHLPSPFRGKLAQR